MSSSTKMATLANELSSRAPVLQTVSNSLAPYAVALNLTKLPPHLPTVIGSIVLFTFCQLVVSPVVSSLVSSTYPTIRGRRQKQKWHMHVISQIHAGIAVPLAFGCLWIEALEKDRLYGWDDRVGTLQAISLGYFIWDAVNELIVFEDLGFVAHGVSCLAIYLFAFSPFLSYYATRCLLWETSTFFLNNHWFLDKTKQTGSTLQLINGVFLIISFFAVRLVYGMWTSYDFWRTMTSSQIPYRFYMLYCTGNVLLNVLNVFWFTKMIQALQKRFAKSPQKKE